MDRDFVIRVEGLGKRYTLGAAQKNGGYTALRDVLAEKAKSLVRRPFPRPSSRDSQLSENDFWAVKDVSFEVRRGEVLGIIGRNGAGKSTLLKILSRITEPTEGRLTLRGRVASLLEVGTGFHPELTGRENIYLNGAILGMHRAEIKAKFDEIVAFAEVEKFLDTPVKRYSSGMYVRLAFAVAAHLEPEILIVDEVLAVGDAEFQKKCLGKMHDVAQSEGRSVLFVSHNMGAVEQLCSRVVMLEHGTLTRDSSDLRAVIRDYLFSSSEGALGTEWRNPDKQYASPFFHPRRFRLTDGEGHTIDNPLPGDAEIWVEFEAFIEESNPLLSMGFAIYTEEGETVFWSYQTDMPAEQWPAATKGVVVLRSRLPARLFNQGLYRIELIAGIHGRFWILEPGKGSPTIFLRIQGGLSDSPLWNYRRPGVLAPVLPWELAARPTA